MVFNQNSPKSTLLFHKISKPGRPAEAGMEEEQYSQKLRATAVGHGRPKEALN